jgi:hypothetical protein
MSMVVGCTPEPKAEPPPWLSSVTVHVRQSRPAYDNHREVVVEFVNQSEQPIELRSLERGDAVRLQHSGTTLAALHPISVGVKKPIHLRPRGVTQASLLFEAAPGSPSALHWYGNVHPVGP